MSLLTELKISREIFYKYAAPTALQRAACILPAVLFGE
jgi:hypothetical protein